GCVAGPAAIVVLCAASTGQVAVPYNSAITVTGGFAPYAYAISAGQLPPGLVLNPETGAITGTPTSAGTFAFTITVTDPSRIPNSAAGTVTKNCSITIAPPPTAACVVINAVQGSAIAPVTMAGSGGAGGPYSFSATGLPAGLTMAGDGTISGTPTV